MTTFDYPVWLRVDHWLNLLFVTLIIRSGIEILATHPKLYWNDDSKPGSEWARFTRKVMPKNKLYDTLDVIDQIAAETGKTVSQVALRWVLQRPSIVSIVVGARNEAQLKENLGAVGWVLDAAQMARLDEASEVRPIYPYWHQREFAAINPPPVPVYPKKS